MLYDAHDHPAHYDPDLRLSVPLEIHRLLDQGELLGSLQRVTAQGCEVLFRNGYKVQASADAGGFTVRLLGEWLSSADQREVAGLSREEVTSFLCGVQALPVPDVADLGEF